MMPLVFTLLLPVAPLAAESTRLSFPAVWSLVRQSSREIEAAARSREAAAEGARRASLHWAPDLYLDLRGYRTNDPGQVFAGLMEQRSIAAADFQAAALNEPGSALFARGALGVLWPLYQGGSGLAMERAARRRLEANQARLEQEELDRYVAAAIAFSTIGVTHEARERLRRNGELLAQLSKNYQLRGPANPVGRSGWLALQAVEERRKLSSIGISARESAALIWLRERGLPDGVERVEFSGLEDFFSKQLRAGPAGPDEASRRARALQLEASSAREDSLRALASQLPEFGIFAEGHGFSGNRATASGYSAGLYARWSLFSPKSSGSYREAALRAGAQESSSEAALVEERGSAKLALRQAGFLGEGSVSLRESMRLLGTQIAVTRSLVRSGSAGVHQLAELLARELDLIEATFQNDLERIRVEGQRFSLHGSATGFQELSHGR